MRNKLLSFLDRLGSLPSWVPGLIFIGIGAVCYLPLINQFGFYNDDWYVLYAGVSQGPAKFLEVYASDRPLRGYLLGFLFQLFGTRAILYGISVFVLSCLRALAMLWMLRKLWPSAKVTTFLAALLFLIYPGFLEGPNALDYQAQQLSFTLYVLSIVLSVKAVTVRAWKWRVLYLLLALAGQLIALPLAEHNIGLEGLRLVLIAYCAQKQFSRGWFRSGLKALETFLFAAAGSLAFLTWRVFIFKSVRYATDVDRALTDLSSSPGLRGLWFVVYQVQDFLNVTFVAWLEPLYRLAFPMRMKYTLEMIILAAIGVLLAALVLGKLGLFTESAEPEPQTKSLVWIGALGLLFAMMPLNLLSRHVEFDYFSRYALPGSLGAALILAGLWHRNLRGGLRIGLPLAFVALAVMTHYANGRLYADRWKTVQNFWWQVSWRLPDLPAGTTLVASYPDQGIAEDYFVWGPANLIYFPELPVQRNSPLPLTAFTLEQVDLNRIRAGGVSERLLRGFLSQADPARMIILSMPGTGACVHVLDAQTREVSASDRPAIALLANFLRYTLPAVGDSQHQPPASIFGLEPEQGWCYYYQKASLARQTGDWEEVVRLGEQAQGKQLRPVDRVEWMPFLEGYAYLGYADQVKEITAILWDDPFLGQQACRLAQSDLRESAKRFPEGHAALVQRVCNPFGD